MRITGPLPILQTERLLLRSLQPGDAPAIFSLRSSDEVNRFLDRPKANTIADADAFIEKISLLSAKNDTFYRAIVMKEQNVLVGTVTLWNFDHQRNKAETGYELLPSFHGRGIMREALNAVMRFAFEDLQLDILEAWTHPENSRSVALLEKLGFKRDVEAEKNKPGDSKEIIYSLSEDRYS